MPYNKDLFERVRLLFGQVLKKEIVDHFRSEGFATSTIYRYLKMRENKKELFKSERGHKKRKLNDSDLKKLKKCAKHKVGVSLRKLGRKFDVSKDTIRRNFENMGLKYYRRQNAPKYSKKQLEEMPKRCRKLR